MAKVGPESKAGGVDPTSPLAKQNDAENRPHGLNDEQKRQNTNDPRVGQTPEERAEKTGEPVHFEGTVIKVDKDGNEVMSDHLLPGEKLRRTVAEEENEDGDPYRYRDADPAHEEQVARREAAEREDKRAGHDKGHAGHDKAHAGHDKAHEKGTERKPGDPAKPHDAG